jgi:hypothetical protein
MISGYCSGEDYRNNRPMDIHVLNTNTLRWSLLPIKKDYKYPHVPFQRYGELILNSDVKKVYAKLCVMQDKINNKL